jgi:hypothetical protein
MQIVELAADLRRLSIKDNVISNLSPEVGSLPHITELYAQVYFPPKKTTLPRYI